VVVELVVAEFVVLVNIKAAVAEELVVGDHLLLFHLHLHQMVQQLYLLQYKDIQLQ
jgi:hypothetical protein